MATSTPEKRPTDGATAPEPPVPCSSDKKQTVIGAPKPPAWDVIKCSQLANRIHNPIRAVVDTIDISAANPDLEMVPLSLGDPTVFGNFKPCDVMVNALLASVRSGRHNGYTHSAGHPVARQAIAERYSTSKTQYTAQDIVIGSGCSGALDLALSVLLGEGDNILVPQPGFPLYETIAVARGASAKHYMLDPEEGWMADLKQLESLVDAHTKVLLINNPSNPCGSVFPESHVRDLLAIAERHKLVVVADEIYANMTFAGDVFTPAAELSGVVPVFTVGGIAKEFLVPGYRLGWVVICDRTGICSELRPGLQRLTQLVLGACTLPQSILPQVLTPAAGSSDARKLDDFHNAVNGCLGEHADLTVRMLSKSPGLKPVTPQGAMYVMVGINISMFDDAIIDDVKFCDLLLKEEAVFVLPGQCFGMRDFFRVVFSGPKPMLKEAFLRLHRFCVRHQKK